MVHLQHVVAAGQEGYDIVSAEDLLRGLYQVISPVTSTVVLYACYGIPLLQCDNIMLCCEVQLGFLASKKLTF